jgi:outer membrane protein assembly factor BamB
VANVPTPVAAGDLVFYSTGYDDGGSATLRLSKRGSGVAAKEVYLKAANDLRNHHGGVVLLDGVLYGGHGQNNGIPFALDFKTGRERWKRGRGPGTGSAAVAAADGRLYFRYESGTMALFKAGAKGPELAGQFDPPKSDSPAWPHPAISDGKLYLRDQGELLVYDLKAN